MARAGVVATLPPGAFYMLRETKAPPVDLFRRYGVPMAVSTDCNPGTSPMTSLLLALNMARDAVPPDRRGVPRRRHAERRARARPPGGEPARSSPASGPTLRSGTSSGRPISSTGSASIRCTRAYGGDDDGSSDRRLGLARRLARDLRGRERRARSRMPGRVAASAAAVARIVARGEPVYGVNTGFGKLASVRIADADLAISSATSCCRTPRASASPRPSLRRGS